MANILEYTLSLNDKLSGKLQQIGVNSDSALKVFSGLQQKANSAAKTMSEMGRSVGSLQQKLDLLRSERDWIPTTAIKSIRAYNKEIRATEAQISKLNKAGNRGLKGMATDAMNSMPGAQFLTNPLVAIGAGLGFITKLGIEAEQTKVAFDVMLGSQEKSAKMLKDIGVYADKTPYEKIGLQEATKTMLGAEIPQENIMKNLRMIGDISVGSSAKMQSVTNAYSKIQSAGKMQGEELNMIRDASGFNVLTELSKMTGKSMATLYKEMEKGAISADMVTAAFEHVTGPGGRFYDMTNKIGQTVGGKLSTVFDNFKEAVLNLFQVIGPVLSPALDVLSTILGYLGTGIGIVVDGFKWLVNLISQAGSVVQGAIVFVAAFTASWWLLNIALTANPIGLIIVGVVALIALIGYLAQKIQGWATLWEGVVGFMKGTWWLFTETLKIGWLGIEDLFLSGIETIQQRWYKFKELLGIGDSSQNKAALAKIDADAQARQNAIAQSSKNIKAYADHSVKSLGKINLSWNSDKKLSDVVGGVKEKLGLDAGGGLDLNGGGKGKGKGKSNIDDGINTIGSGKSNKNITINLGSLVASLSINSTTVGEGINEMQGKVEEALLRVLNGANSVQYG